MYNEACTNYPLWEKHHLWCYWKQSEYDSLAALRNAIIYIKYIFFCKRKEEKLLGDSCHFIGFTRMRGAVCIKALKGTTTTTKCITLVLWSLQVDMVHCKSVMSFWMAWFHWEQPFFAHVMHEGKNKTGLTQHRSDPSYDLSPLSGLCL